MSCCQNLEKIKKVLLIGLGGVGTVYADLILANPSIDLRILVDENRLEKYLKQPRRLNGKVCNFKYILPTDDFEPDLIILSTKSNGFKNAIYAIKNFVTPSTLIISFSNGISSEYLLEKYFDVNNIIYSFVICHTITRVKNNVFHDGFLNVVWGHKRNDIIKINLMKKFFYESGISNTFSNNILKDMWDKFCFNCCVNQLSAIKNYTFQQIKEDNDCIETMKNICSEIQYLADKIGIKGLDLCNTSIVNLNKMLPDAKTSMLQDFEHNRMPEVDLFSCVVIQLAEKYGVDVPYNKDVYNKLLLKYNNEHRN